MPAMIDEKEAVIATATNSYRLRESWGTR